MSDPIRYGYRSSLRGKAWTFALADDGLCWDGGRRRGVVALAQIAQIRLSYRPVSMQRRRFRMDVRLQDGRTLPVLSTTWQSVTSVVPQDDAYRAFVLALHRRLPATACCVGGLPRPLHWLALIMLALVGVAVAGLFIRAVAEGSWPGALFIAGFGALLGWQLGGFVWRNRPLAYPPDGAPAHLLP